jgi:hypothetical protein
MRISYTIKSEDIVAFNIQHLNKLSHIRRIKRKNKIIISTLYGAIALGWVVYKPMQWPMAWIVMFVGILWFYFYPKVWERGMVKKIKKIFKDKESRQELEFGHKGIWAKSDIKSGQIPKEEIKKIVENENYLFLYFNEENAIIIPKKEIEKNVKWEELLDCIKSVFGKECEFERIQD